MINFDAVDFSERRPEEVISFFWRSVYNQKKCNLNNLVVTSHSSFNKNLCTDISEQQ